MSTATVAIMMMSVAVVVMVSATMVVVTAVATVFTMSAAASCQLFDEDFNLLVGGRTVLQYLSFEVECLAG